MLEQRLLGRVARVFVLLPFELVDEDRLDDVEAAVVVGPPVDDLDDPHPRARFLPAALTGRYELWQARAEVNIYRVIAIVLLCVPHISFAACGLWDVHLTGAPATDHEAIGLHWTWDHIAPPTCPGGFTFDHYELCSRDGATGPTSPSDTNATCVNAGSRGNTSQTTFVQRASRTVTADIYACGNAGCTTYITDGGAVGGTASDPEETASTDAECYVVEGLTDESDDRVVPGDTYDGVSSVYAMFYPSGTTYEDQLLLYWTWQDDGVTTTSMKRTSATGWQNFNTATWQGETDVAVEAGTGDFIEVTHPWATFETDGYDDFVRLFFQTGNDPSYQIGWVKSTDDVGDDFGLACTDTGGCSADDCAEGDLCDYDGSDAEIIITNAETSPDVDSASHGQLLWDHIAYGEVNFSTDNPLLAFTGAGSCTSGPADLLLGAWDDPDWTVVDDGGGTCPLILGDSQHDPSMFPLPDDLFKVYGQDASASQEYTITYLSYDDVGGLTTEGQTGGIRVCWDNGGDPCANHGATCQEIPGNCIENLTHFSYIDGGLHEGVMFKIWQHDTMSGGVDGSGCDGGFLDGYGIDGIVFANPENF
jgi:hypothetical protein